MRSTETKKQREREKKEGEREIEENRIYIIYIFFEALFGAYLYKDLNGSELRLASEWR